MPRGIKMVRMKEPAIGEQCRTIAIDGFSDYANPKRVRLAFYSMRMGLPETEGEHQILQLARESEILMPRDLFFKYSDRIAELRKWMDAHPIEDTDMDKDDLKEFVAKNFTSDEITALWLGHEVRVSEAMPVGLIPLIRQK